VKSLKKISVVRLWGAIGFLAGAALAATADSRIGPGSSGHNATFALTTTTTQQISSRNCIGSNCSANSFVMLSRLDGSPVSPGIPNLAPSGDGTLTVSSIGRLAGAPTGPLSLQNEVYRTTGTPSNLAFAFTNTKSQPLLHLTTATMTRGVGSPYLQASGGGFGSMVRQLFCSSSTNEGCISENLFNSNPTIKSAPTGRVTLAPEPTAAFLLGTGLLALGLIRRRQKTGRT
jgi:hypothetical protein